MLQELLTGALLAASLLFWVFRRKKGKRTAEVGASCEGFLVAAAAQGVPPHLLHSVPFSPLCHPVSHADAPGHGLRDQAGQGPGNS